MAVDHIGININTVGIGSAAQGDGKGQDAHVILSDQLGTEIGGAVAANDNFFAHVCSPSRYLGLFGGGKLCRNLGAQHAPRRVARQRCFS